MLVKKFEAENMAAALKQVKETLGSDALIMSTRTLSRKGLGVLGKQMIEVTAAIESPAMNNNLRQAKPARTATASSTEPVALGRVATTRYSRSAQVLEENNRAGALADEQVQLSSAAKRERFNAPERRQTPQHRSVEVIGSPLEDEVKALRSQLEAQDVGHLKQEIDELKQLISEYAKAQAPAQRLVQTQLPVADSIHNEVAVAGKSMPLEELVRSADVSRIKTSGERSADALTEELCDRGIDNDAAATIARFAAQQMTERQISEPELRRQYLTQTVASLVHTSGPLWTRGEAQKRVSLIGATGVGKTTTIAKLAAEAITQSGARVALVTIDTYRIAAVEQLKVYGDIMGLPVEVVLSPDQLQEAFRRHRDKDLILIDTAGRSPRDNVRIEELKQFLGADSGVENCLVFSATTEERIQRRALKAFSALPLSRLIFTKLDEADRCGAMINMSVRSNLPLAYMTNGQQVPEDLLGAEPQLVAELVMNDNEEERRFAV